MLDITIFQNCPVLTFSAKKLLQFDDLKEKKNNFQVLISLEFCKVFYGVYCLYNRVIFYGIIRYKLVSSPPKCLMYSGKTACSLFNLIQPIAVVRHLNGHHPCFRDTPSCILVHQGFFSGMCRHDIALKNQSFSTKSLNFKSLF